MMRFASVTLGLLLLLACGKQVYKRIIVDLEVTVTDDSGRPQSDVLLTLEDIGLSDYRRAVIPIGKTDTNGSIRRVIEYRYDEHSTIFCNGKNERWATSPDVLRIRARLANSKGLYAVVPALTTDEVQGKRPVRVEVVTSGSGTKSRIRWLR